MHSFTFACGFGFTVLEAGAVALHDGSRGRLNKTVHNNITILLAYTA